MEVAYYRLLFLEGTTADLEVVATDLTAFRILVRARDEGGVNVGAFTPRVFGRRRPRSLESWHCRTARTRVELTRRDYFARGSYRYDRSRFLVDGRLPAPAL